MPIWTFNYSQIMTRLLKRKQRTSFQIKVQEIWGKRMTGSKEDLREKREERDQAKDKESAKSGLDATTPGRYET